MISDYSTPLLSVIIPTRNRQKYAISTINSILSISAPELQLVVQDNSDSRSLATYISEHISDDRLCYNYTPPPFSPLDNFNHAMSLAAGEYVCIIGDDDGINPELVSAARWAKIHNIDAIRTTYVAYYFWPDVQVRASLKNVAGQLTLLPFYSKAVWADQEKALFQLVRNAGQDYLNIPVPKIYHGLVKRACMDEVYNRKGIYFEGLSPDIFGAITLGCIAQRVISLDYPLTIGGTAVVSASADSSAGKHKGRLEDAPQLRDRPDYKWSELIPRFYSVQTIWAETVVVALNAMNRLDLLRKFNLPLLIAYCIVANPDYTLIILRNMYHIFGSIGKNPFIGSLQVIYSLLLSQSLRTGRYFLRRLRSFYGNSAEHINNLENIEEASKALTNYLAANNWRFEDCVKDLKF